MSDTRKFPAARLLAAFGVGCGAAALSLAGFGWLMVRQGLTRDAAGPLATAALCLGSFGAGLLLSALQKSRGLVWGAAEGALFSGALALLCTAYQSPWDVAQFVRAGLVLLAGALGGVLAAVPAGRRR